MVEHHAAVFDAIRTRRSIRRYTDQPVDRATIDAALEVATHAPSAHNRQPWRFAVVTSPEAKARLASAMGERLRADRLADGDPPDVVEVDVVAVTCAHHRRARCPPGLPDDERHGPVSGRAARRRRADHGDSECRSGDSEFSAGRARARIGRVLDVRAAVCAGAKRAPRSICRMIGNRRRSSRWAIRLRRPNLK